MNLQVFLVTFDRFLPKKFYVPSDYRIYDYPHYFCKMLEDKNQERTSLEELGEFGLIDHLTKNFELKQPSSIVGVGDDAAVMDHNGKKIIVSTDMLVEGVHFDLSYMPLKHLGYKSVMVNLSDIYAMNAMATQITVSLAISDSETLIILLEFNLNSLQIYCI